MSSKIFLQALQSKLKGGNAKSIHLNALPGRLATRLDLEQLNIVQNNLADEFIEKLFTVASFDHKISFDEIDLNETEKEKQKLLGVIAKRLNSIIIENEDYFKEHGVKTLGFGYPILVKRSSKDPKKIIKAPIFIWSFDAIKSKSKVNEWILLRNKTLNQNGKFVDQEIHPIIVNEVLLSFIKGEDNIELPRLSEEVLEDAILDKQELVNICGDILTALNSGVLENHINTLEQNISNPINSLPQAVEIENLVGNKAFIHFGGVFGLFRTQKESIITDITKLLDRFDEFQFDNLIVENLASSSFSAVDTDPTQQTIITALGVDTNQIIQGPPGTGKSQSLTALIINALANGLRCMVVCEKKTALDIIKQNIEKADPKISKLIAVIDDVNDDREAIVDSVRERQKGELFNISMQQALDQYDLSRKALEKASSLINQQHRSLDHPVLSNKTWGQLVGRYLRLKKKYASVPLKEVLQSGEFTFHGEESELGETLPVLERAELLFNRSKHLPKSFDKLSKNIFSNSAGEGRVTVENHTISIQKSVSSLEALIKTIGEEIQEWKVVYQNFSAPVTNDIQVFRSFCDGLDIQNSSLDGKLNFENHLNEFISDLAAISSNASEFKISYQKELENHYTSYTQSLKGALNEYLSFIEESETKYGNSFFTHEKGIKVNILAALSRKNREKKFDQQLVISEISKIKYAHSQLYIEHQYNDQEDVVDLNKYINNIKEFDKKVDLWSNTIPFEINKYTKEIKESNFHPGLTNLKKQLQSILYKYNDLKKSLIKYNIDINLTEIDDVDDLVSQIQIVKERLLNIQQEYATFRTTYQARLTSYIALKEITKSVQHELDIISPETQLKFKHLEDAIQQAIEVKDFVSDLQRNLSDFRAYYEWRQFLISLTPNQYQLVNIIQNNLDNSWAQAFECWYLFWVLSLNEPPYLPKDDLDLQQYRKLKEYFNEAQLRYITTFWSQRQNSALRMFNISGKVINSLYNKRGSKGTRRNSLRTIIKTDFNLFTSFFPVLLLNPSTCSSIIPLEEGIADVVIFDEASQLRLEDTYAAMVRGKVKIVSGDKHQMAPSSYFSSNGPLLDPIEEGDITDDEITPQTEVNASQLNLADSESLLAYAEDRGFKQSYLNVHYRSKHPFLIEFSNHAFYGRRLIPIPAKQNYNPIEFIEVNGLYEAQTNEKEALKVVDILKNNIKPLSDGSYPSVGVATFNIDQRNLIIGKINAERNANPAFDALMTQLGDSFFAKNLENIQGDERDIIILSTTFGRKANGTFTQNFGPIIQSSGHRMLNVIITRARHKIFICTSFPQEYTSQYSQLLQQMGNRGRAILYAYLMYAKSTSECNEELRKGILDTVSQCCSEKHYESFGSSIGSESPFEDEVYDRLAQNIGAGRIEQQHKVGGFRIDMVIKSKHTGKPVIAIECDGAKYHSSPEAYSWDIFRQEQLEQFGFVFHRIWSTNWWDDETRELEKMLNFIHSFDAKEIQELQLQ